MKINHSIIVIFLTYLLISCGRDDFGYIKNETGKTVTVILSLKNINKDPVKYLIGDALDGNSSSNYKNDNIDNYFVSFDSVSKQLTFKLKTNEQLALGTIRIDGTRDSIQYWEFDKIEAIGKGINIEASRKDILKLVEKKHNFFSQREYYLVLK